MRAWSKQFRAFSLIEVVVAIGVLAVGVTLVLALSAPVSRSISTTADSETALRVAERAMAHLRARPFQEVRALLKTESAFRAQLAEERAGGYDPLGDAQVLFASADGTRLSAVGDSEADKYFEVLLVRNESLSPVSGDEHAALLAFTMRVRWPTQVLAGGTVVRPGASSDGRWDHSQKETLFVAAGVAR